MLCLKKNYPITLIGMPNWDGFKILIKKDSYKDFQFILPLLIIMQKQITTK